LFVQIIKTLSLRFTEMIMKIKHFVLFFLVFIPTCFQLSFGQESEESKVGQPDLISMLYPSFAFQWPGGDLADRFGASSTIGPGFLVKTSKNWIWGTDINFIFGNTMKEDSLLQNLATSEGGIIDQQGHFAELRLFERGFYTSFKFGKIFPVFGSNPNSGIMILGSIGYLQHKIRIEVTDNNAPQLMGDYVKGYDRLSDGLQVNQFIGYMHLGKTRLANFFIGVEFLQAWTKNRRSMDFDTMRRDDKKRFDMLTGIKAGWVIPIRRRMPEDFYYY